MRVTTSLNRSFFGRSLDEFKRISKIMITAEGVRRPMAPYILKSFHEPESLKTCKTLSDADLGGFSKVSFDWIPPVTSSKPLPSENKNGNVRFHGTISTDLPVNRPDIQRSGYAAWRTLDMGATIFGKTLWNIDPYGYLALRIKSDGRKYFVNLQTESIVYTDIHQHRLYARRPGEWETVLIDWNEFVRTNHGMVVEPQTEMLRQKVRTIGIGLIDRVPGPYDLSIERIWATNGLSEEDIKEDDRAEQGKLKSKHGEQIRWGATKASKPQK